MYVYSGLLCTGLKVGRPLIRLGSVHTHMRALCMCVCTRSTHIPYMRVCVLNHSRVAFCSKTKILTATMWCGYMCAYSNAFAM